MTITDDPGRALLTRIWTDLDGDAAQTLAVADPQHPVPLAARTDVASLSWASVAAASLAAATLAGGQDAELDPERIAVSYSSERHLRLDGRTIEVWAPLSGFFRSSDGWVRTHGNYPHHAAALRRGLGLASDADRDAVAAALRGMPAGVATQAITAAGGLCVGVAHENPVVDAELRRTPIVQLARIGNAPPRARDRVPIDAPLRGIRVLDLTRVIAGPVATRTLALLGADVLRIDPPQLPEPEWQHLDSGHGKRSTLLDLSADADRARFERLLDSADVVVTRLPCACPGASRAEPQALAARHPGLVVARLTAWGAEGQTGDRRGFDSLVQAASGIAWIESVDGDRPGALPAQALDHSAGYLLAAGTLVALGRRDAEGGSWSVDVSLRRVAAETARAGAHHSTRAERSPLDATPHLQAFAVDGLAVTTTAPAPAFGAARRPSLRRDAGVANAGVERRVDAEVLVVGAGPAGLAVAACLKRAGSTPSCSIAVNRRATRGGARYERLHLHTPRAQSALPGTPHSGDPSAGGSPRTTWPSTCATTHAGTTGSRRVSARRFGGSIATERAGRRHLDGGTVTARQVVIARATAAPPSAGAGPAGRVPRRDRPRVAVSQRGAVRRQDVLVVGAGNTGAEIAADLAERCAAACGSRSGRRRTSFRVSSGPVPTTLLAIAMEYSPAWLVDPSTASCSGPSSATSRGTACPRHARAWWLRPVPPASRRRSMSGWWPRCAPVASPRSPPSTGSKAPRWCSIDGTRFAPDAVIAATGYTTGLAPLVGHLGVLDARGDPLVTGRRSLPIAPGLRFVGLSNPLKGQLFQIRLDARAARADDRQGAARCLSGTGAARTPHLHGPVTSATVMQPPHRARRWQHPIREVLRS